MLEAVGHALLMTVVNNINGGNINFGCTQTISLRGNGATTNNNSQQLGSGDLAAGSGVQDSEATSDVPHQNENTEKNENNRVLEALGDLRI